MKEGKSKTASAIKTVTLKAPVFQKSVIEPAVVNFFWGRNGTGKSTIAKTIGTDTETVWNYDRDASDYLIMRFDRFYVEENAATYGNLPGVYMFGRENIALQEQVDALKQKHAELDAQYRMAVDAAEAKRTERQGAQKAFEEACWAGAKPIRQNYRKALSRMARTKAVFLDSVLRNTKMQEQDPDRLQTLYELTFLEKARRYPALTEPDPSLIPSCSLLEQPVYSRSQTPFAAFVRTLNSMSWLRQGHEQFGPHAEGRCPYCGQNLPPDYEEQLAACFDEAFQKDLETLKAFLAAYKRAGNAIWVVLRDNKNTAFDRLDFGGEYQQKQNEFLAVFRRNIDRIQKKIDAPETVVTLEDVTPVLTRLQEIIRVFNRRIDENNEIVESLRYKQVECCERVWGHIGYLLQDTVREFRGILGAIDEEIGRREAAVDQYRLQAADCLRQMHELEIQGVDTGSVVREMNALLAESGLGGFCLREKPGAPNAYEVVRGDAYGQLQPAEYLSEGERRFLAFLYFYETVKGSARAEDLNREKIVIIDDPVSGLDSRGKDFTASLVRALIDDCLDRTVQASAVRQMFVLTHDAPFYKAVSGGYVQNYEDVSLYMLSKDAGRSTVSCCAVPDGQQWRNYSPVQDAYAALWQEYEALTEPVQLLHVAGRILEHYFIRICGYDAQDLKERILEDHRDAFVQAREDGTVDDAQYQHARELLMLAADGGGAGHWNESYLYADITQEQCRGILEKIFDCMGHRRHYEKMMR